MKIISNAGIIIALFFGSTCIAQELPEMPSPEKEHDWLQQIVGEWDVETEITMEPGQPPIKTSGTETVRAIGGFWVLAEINGSFMDTPFTGVMTLGYDPEKKKYIGTWVDSMNHHMWKYVGSVNAAGKALTLNAKGPCPKAPGKLFKFKEVIEIKNKDHKIFTSSMQDEDGRWTTLVTANYQRKK